MSDISAKTIELSEQLKNDVVINDKGIEVTKDAYEKTLPEGITMDTVQQLQQHDTNFVAAACKAVGEKAFEHMKDNKDVKQMSAQVNMGNNTLATTIQRERQYPNPEGGTSTTYGSMTPRITVGATGNRGDLKKVKSMVADMFKGAADA